MTDAQVFQICNTLVLPQWLLMLVAPGWHVTRWLVKSKIIPVLLGLVYLVYIIKSLQGFSLSGFSTLEGVKTLFSKDQLVLAGWIHYLAFDLFVGGWEWQNARSRFVPHYFLIISLLLTFLFGPLGLLFYLAIRLMYPPEIQAVL